jgi:hypothetical protein
MPFPKINYEYWYNNYSWENFPSIQRMITTMKNWGYIDNDINIENITSNIRQKINSYLNQTDDRLLFEIFKLIQTWGGKSSGAHTREIIRNWDRINLGETTYASKYLCFVNQILNTSPVNAYYAMLNPRPDRVNPNEHFYIKGLGSSFIPKHICFWSGNGNRINGYPILDDVIAKVVYYCNSSKDVDYEAFIREINLFTTDFNDASQTEFTPSMIEMALFAFSNFFWQTKNTATFIFKDNVDTNSIDYNVAHYIASRYLQT